MTVIGNIDVDDLKSVKQLDELNRRRQFVSELASAILPVHASFESVWKIANRLYDLHCAPWAGRSDPSSLAQPGMTALSA